MLPRADSEGKEPELDDGQLMVSHLSFWTITLCITGAILLTFSKSSLRVQRRIYWTLAGTAGVAGIFLKYPSLDDAVLLGLFPVVVMTFMAYVGTPYIKIGGKIYTFTITDPDPEDTAASEPNPSNRTDPHPDSYSGLLTATTMWWALSGPAVIGTVNVYFAAIGKGEIWVGVMSGVFFAMLAVGTAYGDASWGYPIARGQYLQFVVITVITAGVFYFLYVAAYYIGQRRSTTTKQSMEYRVHPRHRELDR